MIETGKALHHLAVLDFLPSAGVYLALLGYTSGDVQENSSRIDQMQKL